MNKERVKFETINVHESTKRRFRNLRKYKESDDDLLTRMLDFCEEDLILLKDDKPIEVKQ